MATSTASVVFSLVLANVLLVSHVLLVAGGPEGAPSPSVPTPPPPPSDVQTPFSFNFASFSSKSPLITKGATSISGKNLVLTNKDYYDYYSGYSGYSGEALYSRPIVVLRTKNGKCQSASFDISFTFRVSSQTLFDPATGFSFLILGKNIDADTDYSYRTFGYDYNYYPYQLGTTAITYESAPIYTDVPQVAFREPFTYQFYKPEKSTILLDYGKFHTTWISYNGSTAQWKVYLSPNSTKPKTPLAVRTRSLCSIIRPIFCGSPCKNIKSAYFGFGANSNGYTSHEIGKWSFKSKFPG